MSKRKTGPHLKTRLTIGMFADRPEDDYQSPVLRGVVELAEALDVNLLCFSGRSLRSPYGFEAQCNVLYDLASAENVDGLVFMAGSLGNFLTHEETVRFYRRYRPLPMVSIAHELEGVFNVLVDNERGLRDVIAHLIEVHGCRRIVFIRGFEGNPEAEVRYRVYREVLAEHGLPFDPNLVAPGDFREPTGAAAISLFLDQRKVDLDAVVAANDGMALGALAALQARGLQVPDDVAVVGFDDIEQARFATPPLTTVRQPLYEQGWRAAEMLVALLEGKEVPTRVTLPTEMVVRRSCGCPSEAVLQAAAPVTAATSKAFETAFAARRARILSDIVQAVEPRAPGTGQAGIERCLDAFAAEVRGESAHVFLPALEAVLRQAEANGEDVSRWHGGLSALRRHVLSFLGDGEVLVRAENLWQQARVLIGESVQRAQAHQRLQVEQRVNVLSEISEALLTTLDVAELMDVAAQQLPRMIKGCYLSLYENPQAPTEWARLMLAYDEKGRVDLEAGGQRFPSRQLIPEDLRSRQRRYAMRIEALHFRENQLGFALFELGARQEVGYETLRGQLSSTLQRVLLLEERKRGEEALARERGLLRTLIDNLPDYIYVKDTVGRFIVANTAVARQMGVSHPDELVGKSDFDFFPRELAERYYAEEQEIIHSGQGLYEHEGPTIDAGRERWISTNKVPLRDAGGKVTGFVGLGRDITERKTAEIERERLLAALGRRSAQLQTAAEVSRAASSILELDKLIQQAVDLIRERFDLYYAGLFLVDRTGEWSGEPGKWAVLRAGTGEAGQAMLTEGHKLEIGGASMVGWCIANKRARIALDVGTEAVRFENPLLPETRSELALPLVSRGEAIGALTVQSTQEAAFSEEDVAILQTMADQLANAIANARLFEQTQVRATELAVLNEVGQALTTRLSIDEVLDEIYRGTSRLMDTTNFYLALYDPDKDEISFPLDVTEEERDKFHTLSADESLTGYIIRNRASVLIKDNLPGRLAEMGVKMIGQPAASWLGVPMIVGDRVLGAIGVQNYTTPGAYDEHDRDLLTVLANQAAIAIQNASLFNEQQQISRLLSGRVKELDCLNDIGRKIDESPPIPDLLQWVAERIPLAMQYSGECVAAVEFEGQVYGPPEAIHLPRQIVGGLRVGGERVGQIYVAYKEEHEFLDEESALLGDIVRRVSAYIENRRLLAQIQAALQEVEATHRRYLRQAWSEYLQATGPMGYEAIRPDAPPLGDAVLPEVRRAMEQRRAVVVTGSGDGGPGHSAVVTPVAIRGTVIGALGVHAEDQARLWTEDEIALAEGIAERMALAAENLRLLDETQRRAERERLIGEITARMRETLNMDRVLQNAAREIGEALGIDEVEVRISSGLLLSEGDRKNDG